MPVVRDLNNHRLNLIAWIVTAAVMILAFVAWALSFSWRFSNLNLYLIFPLFGLEAFSVIWSQYLAGFLTKLFQKRSLTTYFNYTGWLFLALILIHPGLLSFRLWRDGAGLPPFSEWHFVSAMLHWALLIGMTAWLLFLAFEFRRIFSKYQWWTYMNYLVDLAVVGVYYHSLELGSQTRIGWFQYVWYFYGASLILILVDKYLSLLIFKRSKS